VKPTRSSRALVALVTAAVLAACSGQGASSTTTLSEGLSTSSTTRLPSTTASTPSTTSTTTTTLPPTTTIPALFPPLTEELGGGVGFFLHSADRTAGLSVVWMGYPDDLVYGTLPLVITLPDAEWRAVLRLGTDLFDQFSKVPLRDRVREQWLIVAGTITFLELPPPGEIGVARARLEGLVAERPDGTQVRLGDFDVRNDCWGGCLRA
jgi:hypothetical protein